MVIVKTAYERERDFGPVGEFLVRHHRPGNLDGNWLLPTWEYMHYHPLIDEDHLDRCAVWRVEGRGGDIVGVVHYEWFLGEVFFQVAPGYAHLKQNMLEHAEEHMRGTDDDGRRYLKVYPNNLDGAISGTLAGRGYERSPKEDRPMSSIDLGPALDYALPEKFRLLSLADENDLGKIDRCLWRGFDHPGESDHDLEGRRKMQSAPHFRHDLTIVAVEPGGAFVSLCGTWYDPVNRYAYVEPLATDPDYRRMGLGRAVVYEGLRRCAAEGATVGYVGSTQPFYLTIGFVPGAVEECWYRRW